MTATYESIHAPGPGRLMSKRIRAFFDYCNSNAKGDVEYLRGALPDVNSSVIKHLMYGELVETLMLRFQNEIRRPGRPVSHRLPEHVYLHDGVMLGSLVNRLRGVLEHFTGLDVTGEHVVFDDINAALAVAMRRDGAPVAS